MSTCVSPHLLIWLKLRALSFIHSDYCGHFPVKYFRLDFNNTGVLVGRKSKIIIKKRKMKLA